MAAATHVGNDGARVSGGVIGPRPAGPRLVADGLDGLQGLGLGLECGIVNVINVAFVVLAGLEEILFCDVFQNIFLQCFLKYFSEMFSKIFSAMFSKIFSAMSSEIFFAMFPKIFSAMFSEIFSAMFSKIYYTNLNRYFLNIFLQCFLKYMYSIILYICIFKNSLLDCYKIEINLKIALVALLTMKHSGF
jgi:hypothetical protein